MQAFSFFHGILLSDKFQSSDLGDSSPKLHESRIFGPKFKDFYFSPNFAGKQIRGC